MEGRPAARLALDPDPAAVQLDELLRQGQAEARALLLAHLVAPHLAELFEDGRLVFRGDPDAEVVAFTATQIPFINDRKYPGELAGARYPDGIQIHDESELVPLIRDLQVDDVVFSYSDVSHDAVMHKASTALAAGANFVLLGPNATMLRPTVPTVAVTAVRTGVGKSQTTRAIAEARSSARNTRAL